MNFRFDQPAFLWLLLLAAPIVFLGIRSLDTLDATRRWTAITIRLLVLLLVVLMLAGLQGVRWHKELTLVAVIDQSESVRRFAQPPVASGVAPPVTDAASEQTIDQWLTGFLADAVRKKHRDDQIGIVTFDGRASVRAMPNIAFDGDVNSTDHPVEGTDLASGIRLGMAAFTSDTNKRMLLASDGNDTASGTLGHGGALRGQSESELLAAAYEAKAAGILIDVLPIEYQLENEVQVEAVHSPAESRQGQTVALRVVLRATKPTPGLLFLKRDDQVVDLSPSAPSDAASVIVDDWTRDEGADDAAAPANDAAPVGRYVCVRMIQLPMGESGPSRFEALFEPAPTGDGVKHDNIAVNNRAEAFTLVHGKGRVLIVDNIGPGPGEVLPKALRERGIELEVVPPQGLPGTVAGLQKYDAIFLQNVPAEMVVPIQQRALAQYVNDLGGGLVMIGGPDSFGAGGWTNTPIDRILPVECQIPSQTILPSGALVIVLDRSGSMSSGVSGSNYSKQEVACEAAVQAIMTLYPEDMVGVVAFDHSAKWVVNLTPCTNPSAIAGQVRSISPGGGTNIYPGLEEAYNALAPVQAQDAAVKHVILLTDGQSQDGEYHKIVGNMVRAGITLSTVGVGDDVNNPLLQQLASMAGGTYYPVTNANSLPQIFIKEARTIRKNLVKEKPFVPQYVQTGSPILAGMPTAPALLGLVLTGPKNDPRVFMPMLGPEGEPLFAHWQVGLGRTAAFTSDATNRWATNWLPWPGYSDFWARVTRAIARPSSSRAFDLTSTIRNDKLRVRLDATTSQATGAKPGEAGFQNFLDVVGTVLRPDGSTERVKLVQTGPGIYETEMPATQTGNYVVSLFAVDPANKSEGPQAIFGGTNRPPGAEMRRFSSNRALLEQIAAITGGRVLDPRSPEPPELFTRENIQATRSIRPLWRPLLLTLLVLVLLDVASRRIAWDAASVRQFAVERVQSLRDRLRPREVEAAATLSALKKRAETVDQQLAAATNEPAPQANRKFEAAADTQVSEDFAAAVGAASNEARAALDLPKARPGEEAATTSRLFDAKRRARERLAEKEQKS